MILCYLSSNHTPPFSHANTEDRNFKSSSTSIINVIFVKEVDFFAKFLPVMEKYRGMHIAIIGDKIVASGSSAFSVWKTVKKKYPRKRSVLAFVPKKEALILFL